MLKELFFGFFIIALIGWMRLSYPLDSHPVVTPALAAKIGLQVWQNECAGTKDGLTTWNAGEDFASLGIGHFIWYPEGKHQRFKQSFPDLLAFFKSHGVRLPSWLLEAKGCPWQTREEFQSAQKQEKLQELRNLLAEHVDLQILYMVRRLNRVLTALLKHVSEEKYHHRITQFYRLAATPGGLFVLLDYLNFKGEGTSSRARQQKPAWGLLHVLQVMKGSRPGAHAVDDFIHSAKIALTGRIVNSSQANGEDRWLKGWHNRLDGYRRISRELDREFDKS